MTFFVRLLFLFAGVFLFPFFMKAQTDYNITDSSGLKQGDWVKFWDNGVVRYKGRFKDDKPVGEFKYYYPSGKLKTVLIYQKDSLKAHSISYYESGNKLAEGDFKDQQKEGEWIYYHDDGTSVSLVEHYEHGKLDGKKITYYVNQKVVYEIIEYQDGIKNGEWKRFFPDGKIMTKSFYRNGKLDGPFIQFTDEGDTLLKGNYQDGEQQGEWIFYDDTTGYPVRKEVYQKGRLIKTERTDKH